MGCFGACNVNIEGHESLHTVAKGQTLALNQANAIDITSNDIGSPATLLNYGTISISAGSGTAMTAEGYSQFENEAGAIYSVTGGIGYAMTGAAVLHNIGLFNMTGGTAVTAQGAPTLVWNEGTMNVSRRDQGIGVQLASSASLINTGIIHAQGATTGIGVQINACTPTTRSPAAAACPPPSPTRAPSIYRTVPTH